MCSWYLHGYANRNGAWLVAHSRSERFFAHQAKERFRDLATTRSLPQLAAYTEDHVKSLDWKEHIRDPARDVHRETG